MNREPELPQDSVEAPNRDRVGRTGGVGSAALGPERRVPAIRSNASLASVLESLTPRRAMASLRDEYVWPVVLAELGRHEEAADAVARQVDARRERADSAANQYRAFADAFAAWQTRELVRQSERCRSDSPNT
jgi:inorganic triphosphatase YgiF